MKNQLDMTKELQDYQYFLILLMILLLGVLSK